MLFSFVKLLALSFVFICKFMGMVFVNFDNTKYISDSSISNIHSKMTLCDRETYCNVTNFAIVRPFQNQSNPLNLLVSVNKEFSTKNNLIFNLQFCHDELSIMKAGNSSWEKAFIDFDIESKSMVKSINSAFNIISGSVNGASSLNLNTTYGSLNLNFSDYSGIIESVSCLTRSLVFNSNGDILCCVNSGLLYKGTNTSYDRNIRYFCSTANSCKARSYLELGCGSPCSTILDSYQVERHIRTLCCLGDIKTKNSSKQLKCVVGKSNKTMYCLSNFQGTISSQVVIRSRREEPFQHADVSSSASRTESILLFIGKLSDKIRLHVSSVFDDGSSIMSIVYVPLELLVKAVKGFDLARIQNSEELQFLKDAQMLRKRYEDMYDEESLITEQEVSFVAEDIGNKCLELLSGK